jgi:peptidoglycan/LPS O-acetylase OafA/YrhL
MNTKRPLTVSIAIVLLILLSVFGLITPFGSNDPSLFLALYAFIAMGVGGLLAVFGLWKLKRWGLLLTIIIASLSILVAGPGIWFASSTSEKAISGGVAVFYVLVLVLVALPATRKAVAAKRVRAAA